MNNIFGPFLFFRNNIIHNYSLNNASIISITQAKDRTVANIVKYMCYS